MMWLLLAEFRKLARPLVWAAGLTVTGFCLLITWGAANNARDGMASPRIPSICDHAVTAQCRHVIGQAHAAAKAAAAATSTLAQPGEIGHLAAGMLASLPGLMLIALVAGAHWGGEWGLRTIRQLLSRQGRRGLVLVAKWLTITSAGIATMLTCWAVLALAGPLIAAGAGLPAAHGGLWTGFGSSAAAVGRAALVLGLFAAVAVAAGTIGRGQLATAAITAAVFVLALLFAGIASVGRLSPATFVEAWMSFARGGYLPTSFWSRFSAGGGQHLGQLAGLAGIAIAAAIAGLLARWRFATDVTA